MRKQPTGLLENVGGTPLVKLPRLAAWNRRLSRLGAVRAAMGRRLEASADDPRLRRLGDDVFVASAQGVYRSSGGGSNWSEVLPIAAGAVEAAFCVKG